MQRLGAHKMVLQFPSCGGERDLFSGVTGLWHEDLLRACFMAASEGFLAPQRRLRCLYITPVLSEVEPYQLCVLIDN